MGFPASGHANWRSNDRAISSLGADEWPCHHQHFHAALVIVTPSILWAQYVLSVRKGVE